MSEDALIAQLPPSIKTRVRSAKLSGTKATLVLDASALGPDERNDMEKTVRKVLLQADEVSEVRVALTAEKPVRRLIAIGSGKGGVGKSTLTANLAVALARMGRKVGVVDADIYGPSQPTILATEGQRPEAVDNKLVPIESSFGVPVLSMGHLVEPGKAIAWRGPMAGNALAQLIDAQWGDTNLLLVDLPPGTGDVQLTMAQRFKPAGAVIVSTPQDLSLIDARRAAQLFDTIGVPIIGLVENMSGYVCPHCGEQSDPFGQGGVEKAAQEASLPFMGRIPLAPAIRSASDAGTPLAANDSEEAAPFRTVAEKLAAWLDG